MSKFVEVLVVGEVVGHCDMYISDGFEFLNTNHITSASLVDGAYVDPDANVLPREDDHTGAGVFSLELTNGKEVYISAKSAARIIGKEFERGQIEGLIQQVQDIEVQFTDKEVAREH